MSDKNYKGQLKRMSRSYLIKKIQVAPSKKLLDADIDPAKSHRSNSGSQSSAETANAMDNQKNIKHLSFLVTWWV